MAFLATPLEIRKSRSIQINIQERLSINMPVEELNNMYMNSCIYFRSIKRKFQIVKRKRILWKVITRKKTREIKKNRIPKKPRVAAIQCQSIT